MNRFLGLEGGVQKKRAHPPVVGTIGQGQNSGDNQKIEIEESDRTLYQTRREGRKKTARD